MKVRVLMATLVITLLMGVQGFAGPCDFACVNPCAACDRGVVRSGDLFGGLKRLVNGVRINTCDPCDPVVACNPCDDVAICNPCDEVCSLPRGAGLGGRLRNLFANQACSPCDPYDNGCDPCGVVVDCDPCGMTNGCNTPKLRPFRNLFNGFQLNRGCFTDCGPCDVVNDCDPCGFVAGPCDFVNDCGPCDFACNDNYCGPRGHLFELPRLNLGRLFNGLRLNKCNDGGICNPCDEVRPCETACFR